MSAEPQVEENPKVADEVKQTTCYMCACRCGINVHIRDNKIRYIEGNKDHPINKGVLCAKGSAGIMQHYSPARLKSPMIKVKRVLKPSLKVLRLRLTNLSLKMV